MPGNPKTSPHYSTPRASRKRVPTNLTLSADALALLDELAEDEQRARSQIVEDALNVYKTSRSKEST